MKSGSLRSVALPALVAAALVGVWAAVSAAGLFPPSAFPAPAAVMKAFVQEAISRRLFNDIVTSLFRVSCGFFGAVALGFQSVCGWARS